MIASIYRRSFGGYAIRLHDPESLYSETHWRPTLSWARRTALRRIAFFSPDEPGVLIERLT